MPFSNPYGSSAPQLSPSRGFANPFDTGPETANKKGGGGFFSHLPNLGGITLAKQLLGAPQALLGIATHPSRYDDLGRGLLTSLESVGAGVAKPFGIPGTDWNLADKFVKPAGQRLDVALGGDYNGRTEGARPQDFGEQIQNEGIIPTLVNTISLVAPVGAAAGAALKGGTLSAGVRAAEAASLAEAAVGTAEEASTAARAASTASHFAQLESRYNVTQAVAHPYRGMFNKVADVSKGASEVMDARKLAEVVPDAALSAHEIATRDARVAEANVAGKVAEAFDHPVDAAAKAIGKADEASTLPKGLTDTEELSRLSHVDDAADVQRAVDEAPPHTPTAEEARVKALINQPAPTWAVRAAESMPDFVNRKLAAMAKPLDRFRVSAVARDMSRYVEMAQRTSRQSEAVVQSSKAAETVLKAVPGLKIKDASHAVGETIAAHLDGTHFLAAAVEELGQDVSPGLRQKLVEVAKRKYQGITDEQLALMTPEQRTTFDTAIGNAVEGWKVEKQKTMQTLLSSSKGAKGLEQYLLGDDMPKMNTSQTRRYRRAMADYRRSEWALRRHPDELAARVAELNKGSLLAERTTADAVAAQRLVGIETRTAERLGQGVAVGARAENIAHSIAEIMRPVLAGEGGMTFDVGLGRAYDTTGQIVVGVAEQWTPITLEQFAIDGPALIRKALENPVNAAGEDLGQGVWAGKDARLGVWAADDGLVYGDISMGTWRGQNLSRSQAVTLGEAFNQQALWDGANNADITLSGNANTQALHAHYLEQALDNRSGFSRFAREMERDGAKAGLTPEDIQQGLEGYMTWDHSLHRANPEAHALGDYFKSGSVKYAVKAGTPDVLMQTVLGLTTTEGFEAALTKYSGEKLRTALAWYHDSHEYVERLYRYNEDGSEKMMTLFDGSQRNAADVFYDLLAVTSVQGSPTQNFGRALSALANMDEFLSARKGAALQAQHLMDKLTGMQAEVMRVTGVGGPGEEILPILKDEKGKALKGQPGTRLSNKFLTPEVRAITNKTSMTNGPKYKVMDVLMGRLDLAAASTDEIAMLPEYWTGTAKKLGAKNLPPERLAAAAERLGLPETDPKVVSEALMEHHGSNALAKLRSFRSNLADPEHSLAVTLDSVMAQMYGFKSTDWGLGDKYATYAAQIREAADTLTARFGREVKPHEVQALLWVFTKEEIGRQDWGRFRAHVDLAQGHFDAFDESKAAGLPADPQEIKKFDPLRDYWQEETGYGGEGRVARQEYKRLAKQKKGDRHWSAENEADLQEYAAQIEQMKTPRETDVIVRHDAPATPPRGNGLTGWSESNPLPVVGMQITPGMIEDVAGRTADVPLDHIVSMQGSINPGQVASVAEKGAGATSDASAVKVVDAGNGNWILEDGNHRVLAASQKGDTSIKATVTGVARDDALSAHVQERLTQAIPDANAPEPSYEWETRTEIPGASQDIEASEKRMNNYHRDVLPEIHKALNRGDVEQARKILDSYMEKQHRSIAGDEGKAFHDVAETTRADAPGTGSPQGSSAWNADQVLKRAKNLPRPRAPELRGDLGDLKQQFFDQVKGSTGITPNKEGRLIMRLFQGADLGTLFHEGAHLLRQILPEDQLAIVSQHYPNILDRSLTTARRTAEEAFVGDLMYWMRGPERGAVVPGMENAFGKIGATLEEQFAALSDATRAPLNNDISAFWDRLFLTEAEHPNALVDPLRAQAVVPGGVETKRFRWESEAEFAQRARQYGEARERVQTAKFKATLKARTAAKANDGVNRMRALLDEPTRAQHLADKLAGRAGRTLDKLAAEMDAPTLGQVSGSWQPLWEAVMDLHGEALLDDTGQIAEVLQDIPETFSEVLRFAAERGFEPTHIQDMTWEHASKSMFSHVTLGQQAETAATRKARTGALSKAGLADRSIEALAAGAVDATHEVYTNRLVHFIEENYGKPLARGTEIPDGWVPWEAERSFIMTGERPGIGRAATTDTMVVPKAVADAINSMSKSYDHWAFRGITRITSPWRTWVLTMSPKWYINNFVGNTMLATAEGVRLRDWATAIKQWKTGNLPKEVPASSGVFSLAENESSLLTRGVRDAARNEGKKAAYLAVKHKLIRMNEAVDEVARSAVFDMHLRKGASREVALTRAHQAMVDYGDLSPFERSAVRAVVPFYSWQKGVFKLVARFPNDHPLITAVSLQLGALHQEMMQDRIGGTIPDAYLGLTDVKGLGVVNLRAFNPFQDALQLGTPEGIAQSTNPFVDIFIRMAYAKPEYGTAQPGVSATGTPEQQVNPLAALGQLGESLPQVRLGQQIGGEDVYGQNPSLAGGAASFLGKPRGYSQEQLDALRARLTG